MDISREAKSAIINAGTSKVGATVRTTSSETFNELLYAGLIGPKGGLTVKGSIFREREMERALNF